MDKNALAFYEEALDLLASLEGFLLDLEKRPESTELINEVFRAMHTLKGSGSMFGFTQLAAFVHNIESTFALVRQAKLSLTPEILNLTLQARDLMKLLIEPDRQLNPEESEKISIITQEFTLLASPKTEPVTYESLKKAASAEKEFETGRCHVEPANDQLTLNTFSISFNPHPEFFKTGNNPLIIIEELFSFGEASIKTETGNVPSLEEIDPEKSYLSWEILLKTNVDLNTVRDVFLFVEDICDLRIELLQNTEVKNTDPIEKPTEITDTSNNQNNQVAAFSPEIEKNVAPVVTISEESSVIQALPARQASVKSEFQQSSTGIRIESGKLDRLIGLLGELVTVQARLSQTADNRGDTELITLAQELDSLTGELRDSALKLSMLPINSIFPRLEKLISNAAATTGKKAILQFRGGDTELDKGVMSRLFEPLAQLITCCIENSLESEAKRRELHKTPEGLIEFSAWHSSGNVCISIEDNGHGSDLINNNAPDSRIQSIRRMIEELRGHLDCRSVTGKGLSFSVRMPLNLAIIEGLMVRLDDGLFVFPLSLVEECIELTDEDQAKNFNKNVVMLRGHIIPYIKLRETFRIAGSPPPIQQVVIANVNHQRVGFTVDQVVGEYQTVIKTWGKFCSHTPGITGATILGDGTVALIADLPHLINEERHNIQPETEGNS